MTKIYSMTVPVDADIVDAFCVMQKGFTDQFVYYDKERPVRYMGLGRCIALPTLEDVDFAVDSLKTTLSNLRAMSPLYEDFKQGRVGSIIEERFS